MTKLEIKAIQEAMRLLSTFTTQPTYKLLQSTLSNRGVDDKKAREILDLIDESLLDMRKPLREADNWLNSIINTD